MEQFHGTTILCVRRNGVAAMAGDGQVTLGNIVFKGTARKVRRVYHDKILVGFAAETEHLLENAQKKLDKKHLDMIVANNLRTEGAGFEVL